MRNTQICQLSYIVVDDGVAVGKNYYFSVDSMNEFAQKKHGLSKFRLHELSRGRTFVDRFSEFANDFTADSLVCGHNIASDLHVLKYAFEDAGARFPKCRAFCTMTHFDTAMHMTNIHGKHKYPRLEELCGWLGVSEAEIEKNCVALFGNSAYKAHDARYDATATYLCILAGQAHGDLKGVI